MKYIVVFLWFVLCDLASNQFNLPRILEYVLVAIGIAVIFSMFDRKRT